MANDGETVREVCAEISFYGENCPYFDEDGFLNLKPLADRILAAHEREMAAVV